MAFDLQELARAVAAHGAVARVVIAGIEGSSPREAGTAMLVWPEGQSGTIGGGALEYQAAAAARERLARRGPDVLERHALGPELGQCCGGAVRLLTEVYDADRLARIQAGATGATGATEATGATQALEAGLYLRPAGDANAAAPRPLAVERLLAAARGAGTLPPEGLVQGWMVERLLRPERELWIWGAGHVGRALVQVLAPLPDFALTWVDTGPERFPQDVPEGVTVLPAADPALLAARAPRDAEHLILTYSHQIDFDLCHALLQRGFAGAGLIGSKTKWARFRKRLAALGHGAAQIARIDCPIGDPALGKHPQQIAIGVASALLQRGTARTRGGDRERKTSA